MRGRRRILAAAVPVFGSDWVSQGLDGRDCTVCGLFSGRTSTCASPARTRLFRAAVRHELDTALGEVSRTPLDEEGVGLERRVVAALDAWLGRYVGSMLTLDLEEPAPEPAAMRLGDVVNPASRQLRRQARCGDRRSDV